MSQAEPPAPGAAGPGAGATEPSTPAAGGTAVGATAMAPADSDGSARTPASAQALQMAGAPTPAACYARCKQYCHRGELAAAEAAAQAGLAAAAAQAGLSTDWRRLDAASAVWYPASGALRSYLFGLKALAFVRLRRGDAGQSHALLAKLAELDPADQVGAEVIRALHAGTHAA